MELVDTPSLSTGLGDGFVTVIRVCLSSTPARPVKVCGRSVEARSLITTVSDDEFFVDAASRGVLTLLRRASRAFSCSAPAAGFSFVDALRLGGVFRIPFGVDGTNAALLWSRARACVESAPTLFFSGCGGTVDL